MAAEGVGALAEKLPTLASYSESDGVARRGSGFDERSRTLLSPASLLLVCLLERLGCHRERLGANDGCALQYLR